MVSASFAIPESALIMSAASTLVISVYLLVIVNVFPKDAWNQKFVSNCNNEHLYFQMIMSVAEATATFRTCMELIPNAPDTLPSISEAVDYWRGVSAVFLAVPSGEPPWPPAASRFLPGRPSLNFS